VDPLDTYQRLQAARLRRALPKTTMRHTHLSGTPFVVAGYHLAGELGAPLALMWGTTPDPDRAGFLAVPEPRNRQERFDALETFGHAVDVYLVPFMHYTTVPKVSRGRVVGTEDICEDAPQFVVPNAATASWLFGTVGRFTRYLPVDGDDPVPETVRRTGQNLTFLSQQRQMPGSAVALAATDLLNAHFTTGQLDGETQNLAAVLGWIDPDDRLDGPQSAALAETEKPPAGPLSDPRWDAGHLQHLIQRYHDAPDDRARAQAVAEIGRSARRQIQPGWTDTWRALGVVRDLPEAPHAAVRWGDDRRSWARHAVRMDTGNARFSRVPDPLQAARTLGRAEELTDGLVAQMSLDDPAVMAHAVARGDALSGVVVAVDAARRQINANGNSTCRPLVTVRTDVPFDRPAGTVLHLASDPGVTAVVHATTNTAGAQHVSVVVTAGALTAATRHRLPAVGTRVILSPYGGGSFFPATLPSQIPWTHRMPEPAGAGG
jgi:hypothetical protein